MNRQNLYTSSFEGKRGAIIVLAKLAVFLFALLIMLLTLNRIIPCQYTYSYPASFIDKTERLKAIDEPKIVLVGNSNVAFGFRSELIEDAFGMPVVNMGLHGGLGNDFHENMAKQNVREGDIYVFCHNSFKNSRLSDSSALLAWISIGSNYKDLSLCNKKDIPAMLKNFPVYVKKQVVLYLSGKGNIPSSDAYSRLSFNEYGDNIYSETHEEYNNFDTDYSPYTLEMDDATIARLNTMNDYIMKHGAIMVVAGYPIAYTDEYPDEKYFDDFRTSLSEKLDCPVISDYKDYFYSSDYFFDSPLHLTADGAVLRTQQLIKDLQAYFDSAKTA